MSKITQREEFDPISTGIDGVSYIFPKVVGTSFICMEYKKAFGKRLKRFSIIKDFLFHFDKEVSLMLKGPASKISDLIIDEINSGQIKRRVLRIMKSLKVEHDPHNKFDENAISVKVSYPYEFLDVGFIPANFSKEIMKNYDSFKTIGAEADGKGMRIHMLLYKNYHKSTTVSEPEKIIPKKKKTSLEKSSFSYLRKARRLLEI